jgi:phosphoesterase RecJ-like protein
MAYGTHEQFFTMLERAQKPVIILSHGANADDFASAFGVCALLQKLEKSADIVSPGGNIPKSLSFIKAPKQIQGDIQNIRKLTLKVNAKNAKIDELSYNMEGDELHIHLLPKSGTWNQDDVRIDANSYKHDLIIAIGAVDLETFGDIFKQYSDFFYQTPIINIDHNSANEHFGQVNLVDMSAVSCSEICYETFMRIDESLVDEEIATLFLTGMIYKTRSFKTENVTPRTLKLAGDLITKGARRDEIVQKLYKIRSVETLRLWGRALARLKSDNVHNIVWTMLTRQDFVNAGADASALESIIDELLLSAPQAQIASILYEHEDGYTASILHARRPFDALMLGSPFRAAGTREEARLQIRQNDIVKAEKQLISHLRQKIQEAVR